MSDTKKRTIKKGKPQGRPNPYGLCMCVACKWGRTRSRNQGIVQKIKHKYRTCWKTGKSLKIGAYTD